MKTSSILSAVLTLVCATGCASISAPAVVEVDSPESRILMGNYVKFSRAIVEALSAELPAAGFAAYSPDEMRALQHRFEYSVAAWKSAGGAAGDSIGTVEMFSDAKNRRMAVFVKVVDREGKPDVGRQQELEKVVGAVVAKERLTFEVQNLDVTVNESRDTIPVALP